jgi:hypothetical protein
MASSAGSSAAPAAVPDIYEATRGPATGAVSKGALLTQSQAVTHRQGGGDVVVCGPNDASNQSLALAIEMAAGPTAIHHGAHLATAGPQALDHFQQKKKKPRGHTFYEALGRKAL